MSDLVGTTWRINGSGRRFVVISVDARYALVEELQPARPTALHPPPRSADIEPQDRLHTGDPAMTTEITVPCVAAHLLVAGVLRFLPTDADMPGCPRCYGDGRGSSWWSTKDCPECNGPGRRPLRAGDRIAIQADNNVPADFTVVGPYRVRHAGPRAGLTGLEGEPLVTFLAPGDVVGYATVTNVLPIVDACRVAPPYPDDGLYVCTCGEHEGLWLDSDWPTDLSDHVDAGLVFTPGQIALELDAENDR